MKIAVFADIHGNLPALQAVLAEIEQEKPDVTICAGDIVGCYTESRRVWQELQMLGIPLLRGNHEDYLVACHRPDGNPIIRESVRFLPMRKIAADFNGDDVAKFEQMPMSLRLPGPGGADVLVCHASPNSTSRSFSMVMDAAMEADLDIPGAAVIVAGHIHMQWHRRWRDKLLLLTGSVGLPLQGDLGVAEYALLEHTSEGWDFRHQKARYDYREALESVIAKDFVRRDDPIGWLVLDQMLSQHDRLVPFLRWVGEGDWPQENDLLTWQRKVEAFLRQIERWQAVRPYLGKGDGSGWDQGELV